MLRRWDRFAPLAALISLTSAALAADPYASMPGGPRVVLIEKRAGGALGTAAPSFALYGDRTVIFRAPPGIRAPSGYLTTRLIDTQHRALMARLAPEALAKLGESYLASTDPGAPAYLLHLWWDGRARSVSVFGDPEDPRAVERFPPELRRALGAMKAFSAPAGHWLPSLLYVHFSPMDRSSEAPLPWPGDVPPHGYPSTKANDLLAGLGMTSAHFAKVHRLLETLKPGQAVRLLDRNWAVSYRLPFPAEDAWVRRSGEPDMATSSERASRRAAAGVAVGEPRVVFEVKGGMRGGHAAPSFALYADRLVIFRAPYGSRVPSGYLSTRLGEPSYRELVSRIAPEALLELAGSYDAITGTDPVSNVIHVWLNGRRKTVSVAGHLWDLPGGASGRGKTPPAFLRAYDAIAQFSAAGKPWLPEAIELTLSPRERFREEVLPWPRGWPALQGARASRSGMHILALPAGQFERLQKLLPEGGGSRVVTIDERLWLVSYRLPFPHEETWACFGDYGGC